MRNQLFVSLKAIMPFVALCLVLATTTAYADDWLIYRKPAYSGQILDGETKEPIEGAAVVALYYKRSLNLFGAGNFSSVIEIKETLTDEDGRFHIPEYTTIIDPLSFSEGVRFIIYKPGYVSVNNFSDIGLLHLFSGKMVGIQERTMEWIYNKNMVFRYRSPDIVELPKVVTKDDRMYAKPAPYGEKNDWEKQKLLIKYIREEFESITSKDPGELYLPSGGL